MRPKVRRSNSSLQMQLRRKLYIPNGWLLILVYAESLLLWPKISPRAARWADDAAISGATKCDPHRPCNPCAGFCHNISPFISKQHEIYVQLHKIRVHKELAAHAYTLRAARRYEFTSLSIIGCRMTVNRLWYRGCILQDHMLFTISPSSHFFSSRRKHDTRSD